MPSDSIFANNSTILPRLSAMYLGGSFLSLFLVVAFPAPVKFSRPPAVSTFFFLPCLGGGAPQLLN